jgi:HPr kinase/phosphorylase
MIAVNDFVKSLSLKVLCPSTRESINIKSAELNRPGIQFTGYFEYFAYERPQVIGKVEMTYLEAMQPEARASMYETYFSYRVPCVICCRNMRPPRDFLDAARAHGVGVYLSDQVTTRFTADMIAWLYKELAPRITRHGVLVDVYGEGVLIMGESGIGKSEAAVELIKRGHRLIADDAVEIRRINPTTLVGSAPELIRYYVEMRGIGVIDVRQLFGMGAVKDSQNVDLIINLEQWKQGRIYDRLGMEDFHTDILDVSVPSLTIPIKPGRNLSIIIEVAAMNNRHKKMGYNAAQEFTDRLNRYFDDQMAAMEAKNGNNRN